MQFSSIDNTASECAHHNTNAANNLVAMRFQSLAKLEIVGQNNVRLQPLSQGCYAQISSVQAVSLQATTLRCNLG